MIQPNCNKNDGALLIRARLDRADLPVGRRKFVSQLVEDLFKELSISEGY